MSDEKQTKSSRRQRRKSNTPLLPTPTSAPAAVACHTMMQTKEVTQQGKTVTNQTQHRQSTKERTMQSSSSTLSAPLGPSSSAAPAYPQSRTLTESKPTTAQQQTPTTTTTHNKHPHTKSHQPNHSTPSSNPLPVSSSSAAPSASAASTGRIDYGPLSAAQRKRLTKIQQQHQQHQQQQQQQQPNSSTSNQPAPTSSTSTSSSPILSGAPSKSANKDLESKLYRAGSAASSRIIRPSISPASTSPILTGAADPSSHRPPLDATSKSKQAATLFSLMSAAKENKKPLTTHQSNKSMTHGIGQIDLSALISKSQQEHVKQKEMLDQHERRNRMAKQTYTADNQTDIAESTLNVAPATNTLLDSLLPSAHSVPFPNAVASVSSSPLLSHSNQFRQLYERTKSEEAQLADIIANQSTRNYNDDQTDSASSNHARVASLRSSIRATYLNLLTNFSPRFSVQKNLVHKLWMNVYREIDPIIQAAKEAAEAIQLNKPPAAVAAAGPFDLFAAEAEEERATRRQQIDTIIDTHFDVFDRLSSAINNKHRVFGGVGPSNSDSDSLHAARQILSSLCVCLGDLERYRQQQRQQHAATHDWSRCKFFYQRSLLLDPTSTLAGKSHNQLALLSSYSLTGGTAVTPPPTGVCHLTALYHYIRALHTPMSPFPARENILALYEENRVSACEIMRKIQSNLQPSNSTHDQLLQLFVRLHGILDSHIGTESFDRVFQVGLGDKLKSALNQDWRHTGGAVTNGTEQMREGRTFTEEIACKMMIITVNTIEQCMMKDAIAHMNDHVGAHSATAAAPAVLAGIGGSHAYASRLVSKSASKRHQQAMLAQVWSQAIDAGPNTPCPFPLTHYTRQAIAIFHEIFGVLARMPALLRSAAASVGSAPTNPFDTSPTPFLPCLTIAIGWIASKWPWVMTQPEFNIKHNDTSIKLEPIEYARQGLANLANMMDELVRMKDAGELDALPPSHTHVTLSELDGFQPLMECVGFWCTPPSSLDSWSAQSRVLLSFARRILFSHPATGRMAARPQPNATLSNGEQAALAQHQAQWETMKGQREQKQGVPPKKRVEKQSNSHTAHVVASDSHDAEDDSSSSSQDEEAHVLAKLQSLSQTRPVNDEDESSSRPSALESMISDENLGIATDSHTTPATRSDSSALTATPSVASHPLQLDLGLSIDSSKPLLLLDGPNIAMAHGKHKLFSVRGIELCLDYWHRRGFRVLIFLPDSLLDYDAIGKKRRAIKAGFEVKRSSIPDNIGMLRAWQQEGLLTTTPANDYDDTYLVEFGRTHSNALIVSNDKYRDHIEYHSNGHSSSSKASLTHWLRSHLITYTFIDDQFHINPDWKFDQVVGLKKIVKMNTQHQHQQHTYQGPAHGRR